MESSHAVPVRAQGALKIYTFVCNEKKKRKEKNVSVKVSPLRRKALPRQGKARQGKARQGKARHCKARGGWGGVGDLVIARAILSVTILYKSHLDKQLRPRNERLMAL